MAERLRIETAARWALVAAALAVLALLSSPGCSARADTKIRSHMDASLLRLENKLVDELHQSTEQTVATTIKSAGDVQNKVETVSSSTVGMSGPWIVGLIVGLAVIGAVAFLVARYFKSQVVRQIEAHGYNDRNWKEKERVRSNRVSGVRATANIQEGESVAVVDGEVMPWRTAPTYPSPTALEREAIKTQAVLAE